MKYVKKLIAIITLLSMIIGSIPELMVKATAEKETELPFFIIETLKVHNEKVVAKEFDITDKNTEEIEFIVRVYGLFIQEKSMDQKCFLPL